MGNFGQAVAQPGQAVNVPHLDVSSGAQQALKAAGDVAAGEQAREREQGVLAQRAKAALAMATLTNALHDAHDEVSDGLSQGRIDPGQAGEAFKTLASKAETQHLDGYPQDQRETMQAHAMGVSGALQRSVGKVALQRMAQNTEADIDQTGEQLQRDVARRGPRAVVDSFNAVIDLVGDAARLNPQQAQAKKQAFKERTTWAYFDAKGTEQLTRGDLAGLQATRAALAGPEGEAMDPARRTQLTHQIFGWEQHLVAQRNAALNRAESEQLRRENEAVDSYNKATDIALAGGYFSPAAIKEMTTAAAGTKMAPAVGALLASQATVAGFASANADQRQALIESRRADRATPGKGTDTAGEKLLGAMVAMDTKLRAAAQENPWAAAAQAGRSNKVRTIDAGNPQAAVQIVQERMREIADVELWAGRRVSPLQPQEVEQVGKMVRALPIDQGATLLASFGQALNNGERTGLLAKQLHDKDGAMGLAMNYATASTTAGRTVAELILRGDQALRDKTAAVDKANTSGWRASIAKEIRGLYGSQQVEDATIEAAYFIAAGKYAQNGSADIAEAVKLATGGSFERGGVKAPLPYGMKQDAFDKQLAATAPAQLAQQATDSSVRVGGKVVSASDFLAQLPNAALVHAGQGLYNVRAGSGVVTNAQGQRITFKVAP